MSDSVTKRFLVAGRVQGVWVRASTQTEAGRLGLTGHAINLPDGRVEVLAAGPPTAVAELEAWLHGGPPLAKVTSVEVALASQTDIREPGRFVCG